MDFISLLPEGCVSHIISFTTPRDACRASAASWAFKSAADSDIVWETFLPADYEDIIAGSVSPIGFSTKKELFFRLCDSIIVDGGKMSFSLEKMTGRKCYMLSARKLFIAWSEVHRYWKWITLTESRFPEVVELLYVCWLEIWGKIDTRALSPETTYKAYLVLKISEGAIGLDYPCAETIVKLGSHEWQDTAFLQSDDFRPPRSQLWNSSQEARSATSNFKGPKLRSDGWMEIKLGEFFSGEGHEGDVEIGLLEIKGGHWKRGLVIQGIEIRPA